jgi:2-C-methyl-D-erythritol 4-phosphate cytidylyltransferase
MRREAAVVVAAGLGRRLGPEGARPKALMTVAGRSLLELALIGLRDASVREIVVVHTPGHEAAFAAACERQGVTRLVPGGDTRTASVGKGLAAIADDVDVVAVHDAARPLTPPRVIRAVLDTVGGDVVAVAPGVAVTDTLKRVSDDRITGTLDRRDVHAIHTPQAFVPAVLRAAMEHVTDGTGVTDDLSLVERALADGVVIGVIRLVAGSPWDLKITYPEDLEIAEALLAARGAGGRA